MPIVVKSVSIDKYLEWLNNSGEEFLE
jgi:hypothetical protein